MACNDEHSLHGCTDRELIERIITNSDRTATGLFFGRYYQAMVDFAGRHLPPSPRSRVVDVAQQTLMSALFYPKFDRQGSVRRWMYRVNMETCRRRWRRWVRTQLELHRTGASSPEFRAMETNPLDELVPPDRRPAVEAILTDCLTRYQGQPREFLHSVIDSIWNDGASVRISELAGEHELATAEAYMIVFRFRHRLVERWMRIQSREPVD
jgi:DNA-directed RNA polymerase specialized sigma24 family protein